MSIAEILSTVSIVSFVLAGVSFFLAVLFWIYFNIPAVIGDLSGRTARKSIEKMRANNEKTGNKSYKPSKTNLGRGKLTDTMAQSEKLTDKIKLKFTGVEPQPETGLLDENKMEFQDSEQTAVLMENEETGILHEEETGLLQTERMEESEETGLLMEEEETGLLQEDMGDSRTLNVDNMKFVLLEEVMLIHTNEVIE